LALAFALKGTKSSLKRHDRERDVRRDGCAARFPITYGVFVHTEEDRELELGHPEALALGSEEIGGRLAWRT
jgi:hypothetical protein